MMHNPGQHDFLVLGATGMQGRIVSRDLIESGYRVFLSDLNSEDLRRMAQRYRGVFYSAADLRIPGDVDRIIVESRPKLIVNCAEMDWNVSVHRAALNAGVHIVDLGTDMPWVQEQLAMDDLFRSKGLTAITGCGSTPGITDVMLDHVAKDLERLERVDVGFVWDSNMPEFVVPFSMDTIISEFTDLAPYVENGEEKDVLPMDSVRRITMRGIEEQRCFLAPHPETYTYYQAYKERGLHTVKFYSGFPDHSFDTMTALFATLDETKRV